LRAGANGDQHQNRGRNTKHNYPLIGRLARSTLQCVTTAFRRLRSARPMAASLPLTPHQPKRWSASCSDPFSSPQRRLGGTGPHAAPGQLRVTGPRTEIPTDHENDHRRLLIGPPRALRNTASGADSTGAR
jgi:hypothetical protein